MGAQTSKRSKAQSSPHPGLVFDENAMQECCPRNSIKEEPEGGYRGETPDYTPANRKYLAQKTQNHAQDSLEKVVENLVKEWEAEASHKPDPTTWKTIDLENWYLKGNDGRAIDAHENVKIGNYNSLMNDVDKSLYDFGQTWEDSHDLFRGTFKTGFAWEVLKVFVGPPKVSFTWRHWGHLNTSTLEEEMSGKGKLIEMFGVTRASVIADEGGNLKLQGVENFFDATGFLKSLQDESQNYE